MDLQQTDRNSLDVNLKKMYKLHEDGGSTFLPHYTVST